MQFPITIPCPRCHSKLKIKEASHLGRVAICPECGGKFKAKAPVAADDEDFQFEGEEIEEPPPPPRPRSKPKPKPKSKSKPVDESVDDDISEYKPKKRLKKSTKPKSSNNSELVIVGSVGLVLMIGLGIVVWMFAGNLKPGAAVAGNGASKRVAAEKKAPPDQFDTAAAQAEPNERPYLLASRPFITAVAGRDYATVYKLLSSHARASVRPEQFVTPLDDRHVALPEIKDITEQQFADEMKKMESARGIPVKIGHFYVNSTDPKILAGQGDGIETMFTIGGMPKEIPAEIRKAAIRAQIECNYTDEQVKEIAKLRKMSEADVRKYFIDDETVDKPYFSVKFVFVEEAGELKVGYFEFVPPSMLD